MKKVLLFCAVAIALTSFGRYDIHDEIAAKIESAKAACGPDCYRVICTNGVWQGFTKSEYDAYVKSERENIIKANKISKDARDKLKRRGIRKFSKEELQKRREKIRARMKRVTKPHKSQVK